MIRVAITGNIGSGKTTVCRIFESLGIYVYYADKEARKFYRQEDVILSVKSIFGADVFNEDNILLSQVLAERVFTDHKKLRKLNAIIHPLVLKDFKAWADEHINEKYILYESALLFESGFYRHFDKSILVSAPVNLARDRVTSRDNISNKAFNNRLSMQWDEKRKAEMADYIIHNDQKSALIPQVLEMHKGLLKT
jgi:dephospho-CoA kinase